MNTEDLQRTSGEEIDDFDLTDLLPQYFELCRRDLQQLRSASDLKQYGQIRILGHNLKGSGGAYGFPELSEIGATIEMAAKAAEDRALRAGIEQLAAFLDAHYPAA